MNRIAGTKLQFGLFFLIAFKCSGTCPIADLTIYGQPFRGPGASTSIYNLQLGAMLDQGGPLEDVLECQIEMGRQWMESTFEAFSSRIDPRQLRNAVISLANVRIAKAENNPQLEDFYSWELTPLFGYLSLFCDSTEGLDFLLDVVKNPSVPDHIRDYAIRGMIPGNALESKYIERQLIVTYEALDPQKKNIFLSAFLSVLVAHGSQVSISFLEKIKPNDLYDGAFSEVESQLKRIENRLATQK